MCVYACIKRSHRHVTDPVVRVIVYWITEKYRCCTYISGTYTVLLYKEVNHLMSMTRQCLANHGVWNFFKLEKPTLKRQTQHARPPDHRPPLTLPLPCSLTLLMQKFSASLINWITKQSPLVFSTLQPFKLMTKDGSSSYDNCYGWLSYEQLTNHKKSNR